MPYYSECCGAYSHMAPEIDLCPVCKEHTDWINDDFDMLKCGECEHLRGDVEKAVDYCNHHKFIIKPVIEDFDTCLNDCPLLDE